MIRLGSIAFVTTILLATTQGHCAELSTQGKAEEAPRHHAADLLELLPAAPVMLYSHGGDWNTELRKRLESGAPPRSGEASLFAFAISLVALSSSQAAASWNPATGATTLVVRSDNPGQLPIPLADDLGFMHSVMNLSERGQVLYDFRAKEPAWISPRQKPEHYAVAFTNRDLFIFTTEQDIAIATINERRPRDSALDFGTDWITHSSAGQIALRLDHEPGTLAIHAGPLASITTTLVAQPSPWIGNVTVRPNEIAFDLRAWETKPRALADLLVNPAPTHTDHMIRDHLTEHTVSWARVDAGNGAALIDAWLAAITETLYPRRENRVADARQRFERAAGRSLRHHLQPLLTGEVMIAELETQNTTEAAFALWLGASQPAQAARELMLASNNLGIEVGRARYYTNTVYRITIDETTTLYISPRNDSLLATTSEQTMHRLLSSHAITRYPAASEPGNGMRIYWNKWKPEEGPASQLAPFFRGANILLGKEDDGTLRTRITLPAGYDAILDHIFAEPPISVVQP